MALTSRAAVLRAARGIRAVLGGPESLDATLEVGAIAIKELCRGSLREWNLRPLNHPQHLALERELRRLDCDWQLAEVCRAVRVFEQARELVGREGGMGLTLGHLHVVQGLPWPAQRALLDRAQNEGWDASSLKQAAAELAHAAPVAPREAAFPLEASVEAD